MAFIRKYFKSKIGAIRWLLDLVGKAWDERIWLAVILVMLWTIVCTIGGILFMPIDFVWSAILWNRDADTRNEFEDMADMFIDT